MQKLREEQGSSLENLDQHINATKESYRERSHSRKKYDYVAHSHRSNKSSCFE